MEAQNKKGFLSGTLAILTNVNFLLIIVVNMVSSIAFSMINTPVTLVGSNLGLSATLIGLIASLYSFSKILVRPFMGNSFKRWNPKWVYMAVLFMRGLVAVAYAFTNNIPMYIFSRLLQGVNFGCSNLATQIVVAEVVDREEIGSAFGLSSLLPKLVAAYTTIVSMFFYQNYGASVAFWASAAASVLSMVLLLLVKFPDRTEEKKAFQKNLEENRAKKKGINDYIFLPAIPMSCIVCLLCLPTFAMETILLLYCKEIGVDFGAEYLAVYAAMMGIGAFAGGLLGDRLGEKFVVYASMIMAIVAFPLICITTNKMVWMASAVLVGLYNAMPSPAIRANMMRQAGILYSSIALATFCIFQDIASTISSTIAGFLSDAFGFRMALCGLAIFPFIAMIIYTVLLFRAKNAPQTEDV